MTIETIIVAGAAIWLGWLVLNMRIETIIGTSVVVWLGWLILKSW